MYFVCTAWSNLGNWFAKFWYAVRLELWETVIVFRVEVYCIRDLVMDMSPG